LLLPSFVGRLDDIDEHGLEIVRELPAIVATHRLATEGDASSVRHPRHVTAAAFAGAHIRMVPMNVLRQMMHHPLTAASPVHFRANWDQMHVPRQPVGLFSRHPE
jgi:transaldolase